MTPRAERALIRRVVAGDRTAASDLIKAHQASLFAYMLRLTGRPETAEDVTQEAFVRALTKIERYDPRFRFSTWLFTIAKRLYVNANQRLTPAFDTDTVGAAASRTAWLDDAGDTELSESTGGALQRALSVLSDEQREVLVLFYQLQWPVEHIGEYLDLPTGTVKSHLHRARARLREALEAQPNLPAKIREVLA
ncbi:MAG: RNA polymerase sigma factor [Phycisphaerales bacterium]